MLSIKSFPITILVLSVHLFVVSGCAQESKNVEELEYVSKTMDYLASDELEGRKAGTEGYKKAVEFVEKEFKTIGLNSYFETYRDTLDAKGNETYNVVAYLKGTDKTLAHEFVIIGAHLDHIGVGKVTNGDEIANGANDNASGSTAVLALARYFAKLKTNKRSLLFVLFGAEEMGLLGSDHLAKRLKEKDIDIYTMINFEMIGVPLSDKSYMAYLTGYELSNMADKINEYSREEVIGYLPKSKEYQLFKRSDNYAFYKEYKIPAQTISTFDFTNYNYYHHVDDEAEFVNYEFMAELIQKIKIPLLEIINSEQKEIIIKDN